MIIGTGKHKNPAESTQGTLTYQEVCEEIGKLNGLETVEAMRKKPCSETRGSLPLPCRRGRVSKQKKLNSVLNSRSARTFGNQGHEGKEGLSSLFRSPLQTLTTTFTSSFSAELGLLLRESKALKLKKKKTNKNPIRSRSASNKFISPYNLPLQTSGAWQCLDDLLREQE